MSPCVGIVDAVSAVFGVGADGRGTGSGRSRGGVAPSSRGMRDCEWA